MVAMVDARRFARSWVRGETLGVHWRHLNSSVFDMAETCVYSTLVQSNTIKGNLGSFI